MTRYLLDTNTVSYAMRGEGDVGRRLLRQDRSRLAISVITLAELRYGAYRKNSPRLHAAIEAFLLGVQVLDFTADAADRYAALMATLDAAGRTIDDHDGQIAGHALSLKATLVTHNTRHFRHVPDLRLDDWF